MHNAFVTLDDGQLEKASEFLWGGMALAVKAVAAMREIELGTHDAIWEYAKLISQQLDDEALFNAFRDANRLHVNFYDSGLTREMVLDSEERIRQGVAKLLNLMPRELLE